MRKRRVFALLLAFSMVFSSNTMAVFAAPENPTAQEQGQEDSGLTEAQKLAQQKRQEADAAKAAAEEKAKALEDANSALEAANEALKVAQGTPVDEKAKNKAKEEWEAAEKAVPEKQDAVIAAEKTLAEKEQALADLEKKPADSTTPSDGTESTEGTEGADNPEGDGVTDPQESSDTDPEAAPAAEEAETKASTTVTESVRSAEGADSPEVEAARKAVADAQKALKTAEDELAEAKRKRDELKAVYEAMMNPTVDEEKVKEAQKAVDEATTAVTAAQKAYDEAKAAYEKAEAEAVEAEEAAKRDVSFTDPTGQKVTYDANEANSYIYEIENGVLKSVKKKGESEGSADIPVEFKGNVELRQPQGDQKYTSIAASVFAGNPDITYVKLPQGITTITAESFKGCTSLTNVYLPATVTTIEDSAFENCTAMTQISLPKEMTSIGAGAFKNDTKLHLVSIRERDYSGLTSIGASAFEGCSVLSEFCSDVEFVLPKKLETIGEAAFRGCKNIRKVDMSETQVTTVGAGAFEGCIGIKDLVTGKKLSQIGESAFSGCSGLASISFVNGVNLGIGNRAFSGCVGLRQLTLPQSVTALGDGAFQDCTRLTRVEVKCYNITLGLHVFPTNADGLILVAEENSAAYQYAIENGIRTPDKNAFYKYTVEDVDGAVVTGGKFPGGTLWIGTAEGNEYANNINTLNNKKGVKSGEKCYVYYSQTQEQKGDPKNPEKGYTFIPESLRCNGEPIKSEKGKYYFEMPEGGAVITAEFRKNTPDKITGQKVKVEFSNGAPIQGGQKDEIGYLGVELKVGQSSRMYLIDEAGVPVPSAQIKYSSKNTKIATVNANGTITAVGTNGAASADTVITAKVIGGDGKEITVNRTVSVTTAEVENLYLQASGYNESLVRVEGEREGIQTASILKNLVANQTLSIKLKANADDGDVGVSRELTWATSNSKVAVLAKEKTEAKDPNNVITVQKGCEGEATIMVTATNSSSAEKKKITQKFVIRVYQKGYTLTSSSVKVNPNSSESGYIDLISAYDIDLEDVKEGSVVLYEKNSLGTSRFTAEYDPAGSKDSSKRFRIKPDAATISDGTYEVRVGINGEKSDKALLPLKITVKRSMPNPTIKFNSKDKKINLFYKNGGTTSDGKPNVITTKVSSLGDDKIRAAALEPLTSKEDDKLFTENFVVDEALSNYEKGEIAIRRSGGELKYTSQKKAALTGYLMIYYEGYGDSAAKKMKVTIPTCTTAPSYALRETKAVYRLGSGQQSELLEIYNKKDKKKAKVTLDGSYTVQEAAREMPCETPEIKDGAIAVKFTPQKGKMKFVLQNSNWDVDKNGKERTVSVTYNVSISSKKPVLKNKTVTLNLNYPDVDATFEITGDQKGLSCDAAQTFTPVVTTKNASEIRKINVTYVNGEGVVGIEPGQTVKKGTYKFTCSPKLADWPDMKDITLSVKVVDAKPAVKLGKGSLKLNTVALRNNNLAKMDVDSKLVYRETAEISFKVKDAPEGYMLADVGTGDRNTLVTCTTEGKLGLEDKFDFYVREGIPEEKIDNVLGVSLKDSSVAKGTYTFRVTPRYVKADMAAVSAASVKVSVKVYSNSDIGLKVSAKGKINLVNRVGEASDKNGIIYTPSLKNLSGEITDVRIYDAGSLAEESKNFDIQMITEGKNKGKFYVTPKKTVKSQTETSVEYEYAQLEYNKKYPVRIWVQVDGYAGTADTNGGVLSGTLQLKASQVLPKVKTDKSRLDLYLAAKDYDATFVVKPQSGAAGIIEDVVFGEKDEKAQESFELQMEPQKDGSMKVTVHLKQGLEFPNGSTNEIKMYVKYKGQGDKTSKTATPFTMKFRIN